jgi:hypothetical protein
VYENHCGFLKIMKMAKELFNTVKETHMDLIAELLHLGDSSEKEAIKTATLIIFISGIDKILSFAGIFFWIAGKVNLEGLVYKGNRENIEKGNIIWDYGLGAKCKILNDLGIKLDDYKWLSDLRNYYVHGHRMHIGYKIYSDFKDRKLSLKPGLDFLISGTVNVRGGVKYFNLCYEDIINRISKKLDETDFERVFKDLKKDAENLPINPEPFYSSINNLNDEDIEILDKSEKLMDELNQNYIGKLLKKYGLLKK